MFSNTIEKMITKSEKLAMNLRHKLPALTRRLSTEEHKGVHRLLLAVRAKAF